MNVADLRREHEVAQGRSRELSAELERERANLKDLRARRLDLLGPAGLGNVAAGKDLAKTDEAIRAALQHERTVGELGREVHFSAELLRWTLLRALVLDELGRLPSLESSLAGALRPLGKAIGAVDLNAVGLLSRQFLGPGLGRFASTGVQLRAEIAQSVHGAVAALVESPNGTPAVSLANVEATLRDVLIGIDSMERMVERRRTLARQQAAIDRSEQERATAI